MIAVTKSNGKRSPGVINMDDETIIQYYLDGMKAQDRMEKDYEDAAKRGEVEKVSTVSLYLSITRSSLEALVYEIRFRELEWVEWVAH